MWHHTVDADSCGLPLRLWHIFQPCTRRSKLAHCKEGSTWPPGTRSRAYTGQLYYASNILYVLTLGLIKCSASLHVAKLTVKNLGSIRNIPAKQRRTLLVLFCLIAAWIVSSLVVLLRPCDDSHVCVGTVRRGSHSTQVRMEVLTESQVERWTGILAGDILTDVAIAAFAATIIWRTQASIRARTLWYLPFCIRLM